MLTISRIVVPVDFSAPSAGAARYARSLAAHFGCELTLLHVLETTEFDFSPIQVTAEQLDLLLAGRAGAAQRKLESFPDGESENVKISRLVLKGDPAAQILAGAHSDMASMIVMPTHGYDPIRRFLLGSVASKVLHGANVPVITGTHFEEHSNLVVKPRHIVCGLDLGPNTARVLEWAAGLAEQFGAQLTVAHAAPDIGGNTSELVWPDWRKTLQGRLEAEVRQLKQGSADKARIVIEIGEPHKALAETVEGLKADLLVIGRGASEGLFGRLRANSYAIIRACPCSVLSV